MNSLAIKNWPLPYEERLEARLIANIDLVVIHCTELPDLKIAREFGERIHYEDSRTGNSGHYYIDRDGSIWQFVADARIAHHTVRYNERSIGIELINEGRYPHWGDSRYQQFTEPYTEPQIEVLLALLKQLRHIYPNVRWIAGHEDLDRRLHPATDDPSKLLPRRKDPGSLFPWPRVLEACGLARLHADAVEVG